MALARDLEQAKRETQSAEARARKLSGFVDGHALARRQHSKVRDDAVDAAAKERVAGEVAARRAVRAESERDDARARSAASERVVEALTTTIATAEKASAAKTRELESTRAELESTRTRAEATSTTLAASTREARDAREALTRATRTLEASRAMRDEIARELRECRKKSDEASDARDRLSATLAATSEDLRVALEARDASRASLTIARADAERHEARCLELDAAVAAAAAAAAARKDDDESARAAATTRVSELSDALALSREEIARVGRALDASTREAARASTRAATSARDSVAARADAASARDARDALVKRVNALEATLADAVSARDAARATLRATRDDAARATTLRERFFRELDARARRAEAEVIRLCRKHDDASRLAFGNRAAVDRSADRAGELEAEDEEVFQECDDDAR